MKRTTIMVEEELIYELKQMAKEQNKSTSNIIREALALYVAEQHRIAPPKNPLLGLMGIGESIEPTDVSDGQDEEMLRQAVDPLYGWSVSNDRTG